MGWADMSTWIQKRSMLTFRLLPYLRTGTAPETLHGASKVLSGTGIARTACKPVLRPRLASGLLRVPFRLVLGEWCGLALASAP